jgi:hypothetical protein
MGLEPTTPGLRSRAERYDVRRREWGPALETAGITTPARIYDLRATLASNALAAWITVYEFAS